MSRRSIPLHVGDQLGRVEDGGLEHLLWAEGQELPSQGGRPVRGPADQLDVPAERVVLGQLVEQKRAPAADHRQQVVEVVGDAARQPAHGLHLLRVEQLLLECRPARLRELRGGEVLGLDDEVERSPLGRAAHRHGHAGPDDVALAVQVALLHLVGGRLAPEEALVRVVLDVVGVRHRLPGPVEQLGLPVSQHLAGRSRPSRAP
jgi:hypothetical protein